MESAKKRKRAFPEPSSPSQPDQALYQQRESMLFRVPQELRLSIYEHLFSSKRIQWGFRKATRPKARPRQTLALVRTCRRVRDEIVDSWISQIHLTFKTPKVMLDVLTKLPVSTLSKIRHVRVTTEPVLIESPQGWIELRFYFLGAMLKLLPGLRLDTVTVQHINAMLIYASSRILDELISESCGWKELYYISHESTLLGVPVEQVIRHPKLAHWQRIMDARDGTATNPSVAIYRSTLCDMPGAVLEYDTCGVFEQYMPGDWMDELPLDIEEDGTLIKEEELGKEVTVVVRRGFGVDYEEKEGSPLLENDIRRDAPGKTWQEIQCINRDGDDFMYSRYKWEAEEDD